MSMEKEEILRRLEQVITTKIVYLAAVNKLERKEICFCLDESIHILFGIEYLASAVDAKLLKEDRHDDEYPYRYSFVYKGVKIYQLDDRKYLPEVRWNED